MALKMKVRLVFVATYISFCFGFTIAEDSTYDPLSTPKSQNLETVDSIVKDTVRNREWLDGTGPSSLFEQTDRWQHK